MLTSGLVVTLDPDSPDVESTLAAVREVEAFTVDPKSDRAWSVALEADSPEASERWCEWLGRLPGVAGVEVVFVHWDEAAEPEAIHVRN